MTQDVTILCVDDDPINIDILNESLRESFTVQFANNGQQCLESVSVSKPDLILLDVNMPELNGLVSRIKSRSSLGMTEEQEQELLDIIANAEKQNDALYQESLEADCRFANTLSNLSSALEVN